MDEPKRTVSRVFILECAIYVPHSNSNDGGVSLRPVDWEGCDKHFKFVCVAEEYEVVAPCPLPVVLGIVVTIGESVVPFRVVRKACLSDSSDVVQIIKGRCSDGDLIGAHGSGLGPGWGG